MKLFQEFSQRAGAEKIHTESPKFKLNISIVDRKRIYVVNWIWVIDYLIWATMDQVSDSQISPKLFFQCCFISSDVHWKISFWEIMIYRFLICAKKFQSFPELLFCNYLELGGCRRED